MKHPTPYLQRWLHRLSLAEQAFPTVLDLGSGSGRNARYVSLRLPTATVLEYDCDPQTPTTMPWYAGTPIPCGDAKASLVLCQYLLMFIRPDEQVDLCREINRVTAPGGFLIVELYQTSHGRHVAIDDVIVELGDGWRVLNLRKQRAVLEKRK